LRQEKEKKGCKEFAAIFLCVLFYITDKHEELFKEKKEKLQK
jgi:hypothetical protein